MEIINPKKAAKIKDRQERFQLSLDRKKALDDKRVANLKAIDDRRLAEQRKIEAYEAKQRVLDYEVQEIVKENVGKSVIIVAHGGTLSVLLQTILGLSLSDDVIFRIRNTSVSVVDLDENQNAIVHTLGDVAHLL